MKALLTLVLALLATACTTTEHVAGTLKETKLETKGRTFDGTIGINTKGQAVVQTEETVEDKIAVMALVNYSLSEKVHDEAWHLKDCRVKMANPQIGGSGEVAPIPSVDGLKPVSRVQEEMGLTEDGDLVVRTREFLDDRLKAEKKYQTSLQEMIKVLTPAREECERQLGYKTAGR
jgi:hypothetical protein